MQCPNAKFSNDLENLIFEVMVYSSIDWNKKKKAVVLKSEVVLERAPASFTRLFKNSLSV